jgi:hypothetical protein
MSLEYIPYYSCPDGVDCKTPCITLAGKSRDGSIYNVDGTENINFNQNGCNQAIACSDQQFYLNNPRVCYKFCSKNPDACALGSSVCKSTTDTIIKAIQDKILSFKDALSYSGCDLYCQDNPDACGLKTSCNKIMSDPNLYKDYTDKNLIACNKYCMVKNSPCGLSTFCANSANYNDPRCIDYCRITGDCDNGLATYCNDINNVDSKSVCKNYYCSIKNPAACQNAKLNYCKGNITDPICMDFCSGGCSATVDGISTDCAVTSQCDVAAISYCKSVDQNRCNDINIYSNMSADEKRKCDFCSCINSSLSPYGNPACIDPICLQRGGYQTRGMMEMVKNKNCPSCMQIINTTGSYVSVNGVTQQMNCSNGKTVSLVKVPEPMALVGKYSLKWKTIQQGSTSVTTTIPPDNVRYEMFLGELPTDFNSMMQSDIQLIWVKIFNVMGEFNYDINGSPQHFTTVDGKDFLIATGGSVGKYSYVYYNILQQFKSYPSNNNLSIFYTGMNSSLSDLGSEVATVMFQVVGDEARFIQAKKDADAKSAKDAADAKAMADALAQMDKNNANRSGNKGGTIVNGNTDDSYIPPDISGTVTPPSSYPSTNPSSSYPSTNPSTNPSSSYPSTNSSSSSSGVVPPPIPTTTGTSAGNPSTDSTSTPGLYPPVINPSSSSPSSLPFNGGGQHSGTPDPPSTNNNNNNNTIPKNNYMSYLVIFVVLLAVIITYAAYYNNRVIPILNIHF